jgi:glycosyltransferase involved in cell wall biosynthesis
VDQKLKGKHLLKRWWAKRGLASTFAAADTLIGVSDGVCAALERLLRGRRAPPIRRIYNPIDLEAFARLAREPAAHPWLQAKETPVILSVGRLVRAKDYPTLIRAFALVRKRQECRLIVLGEGRQRPRLESLIRRLGLADSVDLPGFAPNPFAYMARADLLALSSIFEGNPNVLVEAMAVGTPCVATDCRSGPRETLAGGRYGPLVPTGDARALAQALLATLAHPPEPALLAEAIGRFDRDRAVAAYLHALNPAPPEPGAAP